MLETLSALTIYQPDWCGGLGPINTQSLAQFGHLYCKHSSVIPHYFLEYGELSPSLSVGQPVLESCPVPSSVCTDMELRELVDRQHMVAGQQQWKQEAGIDTFDT